MRRRRQDGVVAFNGRGGKADDSTKQAKRVPPYVKSTLIFASIHLALCIVYLSIHLYLWREEDGDDDVEKGQGTLFRRVCAVSPCHSTSSLSPLFLCSDTIFRRYSTDNMICYYRYKETEGRKRERKRGEGRERTSRHKRREERVCPSRTVTALCGRALPFDARFFQSTKVSFFSLSLSRKSISFSSLSCETAFSGSFMSHRGRKETERHAMRGRRSE